MASKTRQDSEPTLEPFLITSLGLKRGAKALYCLPVKASRHKQKQGDRALKAAPFPLDAAGCLTQPAAAVPHVAYETE